MVEPSRLATWRVLGRAMLARAPAVALLVLVVEPVLHEAPRDGFPFSTYPMFTSQGQMAEAKLSRAVAVLPGGAVRPLPPRLVGTDEVLQARVTIRRAIEGGAGPAGALCTALAQRVAGADGELAGAEAVELRTDTFQPIEYFSAGRAARSSQVHARCRVARVAPVGER